MRRQPHIFIDPPDMSHGDAERMYDFMVLNGCDPVPWQHEFLARIEQASMDKKFRAITKDA